MEQLIPHDADLIAENLRLKSMLARIENEMQVIMDEVAYLRAKEAFYKGELED